MIQSTMDLFFILPKVDIEESNEFDVLCDVFLIWSILLSQQLTHLRIFFSNVPNFLFKYCVFMEEAPMCKAHF